MKTRRLFITLILVGILLLTGCDSRIRVGALQTESHSVELGDAESVRIEIEFGAGDLNVTGGAEKLMESNFTYNVARLKPELSYTNGILTVNQPDAKAFLPNLKNITDFRNEWDLKLYDQLPMDLKVDVGAGKCDLNLAGLILTSLDVVLGASDCMVDLSGDWQHDLDVMIDIGAGSLDLQLPKDIGVRIVVDRGASAIQAPGLTQDGNIFTNAAYGVSDVTLHINLQAGIGLIRFQEVE